MGANMYKAAPEEMANTSSALNGNSTAIETANGLIDSMISSNSQNWTDDAGQAYQTTLRRIKSDLEAAQQQVGGMSGVIGEQGEGTAAAIKAGVNRLSV